MAGNRPLTVRELLKACYTAFLACGVFSFAVNLLMLTLPLFMFQVFDRVMASRSESTLFMLLMIATFALAIQAGLDGIRAFAFVRISAWIDRRIGPILLSAIIRQALERGKQANSNPLRALGTLRQFLTGPGMVTMLDLPWVPIFLLIIFWVNPAMGWAATGGAVVMFILGISNDLMTRPALTQAQQVSVQAFQGAEAAVRNAAVVEAMGMRSNVMGRWGRVNDQVIGLQSRASDRAAVFLAISKSMRMLVQMVIMAVAALQIIDPAVAMTPGMMIASVVILGRALQPVEMGINQARNLIEAVAAYKVIEATLAAAQSRAKGMDLPPPKGKLSVEGVGHQPTGATRPVLNRISFEVEPGEALGIVGPSAAGKSTLARLLVGVEKPTLGAIRLDGAEVFSWDTEQLGRYLGFMPQDVELFAGTVAENIARMADDPESKAVVRAAELAGLHDMILKLPDGYDTQIGDGGAILSGGQRQRVALARALYDAPKLVVLDEPNANLDSSGDEALLVALKTLREAGSTVVLVTHRPQILLAMDKILVLQNGQVNRFGPREEIMRATPNRLDSADVSNLRVSSPVSAVASPVISAQAQTPGPAQTPGASTAPRAAGQTDDD